MNFPRLTLMGVLWVLCDALAYGSLQGNMGSALYKRVQSNVRLNGVVLSRYEGLSLIECAAKNFEAQQQNAGPSLGNGVFNYNSAAKICEGLADNRTTASMIATPNYDYYETKEIYMYFEICIPNPCLYNGVCEYIENEMGDPDFRCTCPYPMGGKICAVLACDSCYRKNDLVIFLNNTMPSTSWLESYNWCRNRGMYLLLDKDKAKHDFVVSVLQKLHPDMSEQVCYWIGLNRTSTMASFKYVDGTTLKSSYSPWSTGRPMSDLCVEIASTKEFQWRWDDEFCSPGSGEWRYYPLCEMYYPFLR